MLISGITVFTGVALIFIKLPRRVQLRLLGQPLALDVAVSALTLAVHWGTFSGVMAATIAGLLTSTASALARRLFGYVQASRYFPGIFNVRV